MDRPNPHDHPARKLLQHRATMQLDSSGLFKRIEAEVADDERKPLTEDEWAQLRSTVAMQEHTSQLGELLRAAIVLRLAKLHPDDCARANREIEAGVREADRGLRFLRDERRGAAKLAHTIDMLFAKQPMPAFQRFLDRVLAMVRPASS